MIVDGGLYLTEEDGGATVYGQNRASYSYKDKVLWKANEDLSVSAFNPEMEYCDIKIGTRLDTQKGDILKTGYLMNLFTEQDTKLLDTVIREETKTLMVEIINDNTSVEMTGIWNPIFTGSITNPSQAYLEIDLRLGVTPALDEWSYQPMPYIIPYVKVNKDDNGRLCVGPVPIHFTSPLLQKSQGRLSLQMKIEQHGVKLDKVYKDYSNLQAVVRHYPTYRADPVE